MGKVRKSFETAYVSAALGLCITGTVVAGYGVFSEKYLDALGDSGDFIPPDVATAKAVAKYKRTFKAASPAGKFALQYLTPTTVVEGDHKNNGWGPIDWFSKEGKYGITINDGCLSGTAYDIGGGTIRLATSNIVSSAHASARIPTAAYAFVSPGNPDELVVKSGNSESIDLHFRGVQNGTELVPIDSQTFNIVSETNNCQIGPNGYNMGASSYDQSDYIKQ